MKIATGYSPLVMRPFLFLCFTAFVTTAAVGQQPDRVSRDSLRLRGGGLEGDIEQIAAQLLMATQVQNQARQNLSALMSGQIAEGNRAQAEQVVRQLRERI